MVIALGVVCVVLLVLLGISAFFLMRFSRILMELEDALEDSLGVMDDSYQRITEILKIPVALASPEVKEVLDHIDRVRDAILYVAESLSLSNSVIEEIEEEPEEPEDPENIMSREAPQNG